MRPFDVNGAQQANHDQVPRPAPMTPRQQFEADLETVKGAIELLAPAPRVSSLPDRVPGDLDWPLL
jgi:hypothetical protein